MRSEHVFIAATRISNRYTLCQTIAQATRRLHINSTRTADTMNKVLFDIGIGRYGAAIKAQPLPSPPPLIDAIVLE
jgi:hypothetical protein